MGYRDAMAVDGGRGPVSDGRRLEMRHYLVSIKVEIHPLGVTATLAAAQHATVETTSRVQIVYRKCQVKVGGQCRLAVDAGNGGLMGWIAQNLPWNGPAQGRAAAALRGLKPRGSSPALGPPILT